LPTPAIIYRRERDLIGRREIFAQQRELSQVDSEDASQLRFEVLRSPEALLVTVDGRRDALPPVAAGRAAEGRPIYAREVLE
jgi:hypothetical protein